MNQPPSCDKVFAIQKLSDFFEIFKNLCKKGKRGERKREKIREKKESLFFV